MPTENTLRVIQWATGSIGCFAIKAIAEHPSTQLVGAWVHSPEKEGVDVGTIAGIEPLGVTATRDEESLLALEADCVVYAPSVIDVEQMCRILVSGKNLIAAAGYLPPDEISEIDERLGEACQRGGVSYHASGIQPGFILDRLALMLTALNHRLDLVRVTEICNLSNYAGGPDSLQQLGFGVRGEEAEMQGQPMLQMMAPLMYSSMNTLAKGLGVALDSYEQSYDFALANETITTRAGVIQAGSVAGQCFDYRAFADGKLAFQYQRIWTLANNLSEDWPSAERPMEFVVEISGDPPLRCSLTSHSAKESLKVLRAWTTMNCVNAMPLVCAAPVGILSNLDLPPVSAKGRFKPN